MKEIINEYGAVVLAMIGAGGMMTLLLHILLSGQGVLSLMVLSILAGA